MSEDARASLTGALWFLSALVLVALFISAAAQQELTTAHLVFASVILALAVVGTPLLLRWKGSDAQQAKNKRQPVDRLLHDLSDADLIELKQRLADLDERDEAVAGYVGDDGELLRRG